MIKVRFPTFLIFGAFLAILCSTPTAAQNFSASIDGTYGTLKPGSSSYLGTQIGAGPNVFNFVEIDDHLDFKSSRLNLSYQLPEEKIYKKLKNLKLIASVEKGRGDDDKSFNTLDANGNNLLIPGVGVGAAGVGFFLPGPNNQITESVYSMEFDYTKIMFGIESQIQTPYPALMITPSLGVEYKNAETTNRFNGNIPFFVRRFAYDTRTKIRSISPTVGLDVSYNINSIFNVFGGAKYAYDFNDGNGQDNLTFTGFGTQTAFMENHSHSDSLGLKAGVDINLNLPVAVTVEGNYNKVGNVPVVNVRDGNKPSTFEYEDADIYSGTIRVTFKF